MTRSEPAAGARGGGSVATRGFLVQTLVALLDVTTAGSSFTEITLEPAVGNDQFDFMWKDDDGSHAVQVKSTSGSFTKARVKEWATALQAARSSERCRLVLVGNIPPALARLTKHREVSIESKNMHLGDLLEQAAHRLAVFLEQEGLNPRSAVERVLLVHALTARLQHLATSSQTFAREDFTKQLRDWIRGAPSPRRRFEIDRILKYAPAQLVGRKREKDLLNSEWAKARREAMRRPRLLTIVAPAGEGKTSLVANWTAELAAKNWTDCDIAFAWSFYSRRARELRTPSSDFFFKEALTFLGDAETAESSAVSAFGKARRLASLVAEQRALLVLDGLEPLQHAPSADTPGALKDRAIASLLTSLATHSRGLCVITTRYPLADLQGFQQNVKEVSLTRLSRSAGVLLLKNIGLKGSNLQNIPLDGSERRHQQKVLVSEFEKLVEDVQGNALALTLYGSYLVRAFRGDIRRRDRLKGSRIRTHSEGAHALRAIEAYESWLLQDGGTIGKADVAILRLLACFDGPADADALSALRLESIKNLTEPLTFLTEEEWEFRLTALQQARLLTIVRDDPTDIVISLDMHTLLRDYFSESMRASHYRQWKQAHAVLYDFYSARCEKDKASDTRTLDSLLCAIAHGCASGEYRGALRLYWQRVVGESESYQDRPLHRSSLAAPHSMLNALANFFDHPWGIPASSLKPEEQARVLGEAGHYLFVTGRLHDAEGPLLTAANIRSKSESQAEFVSESRDRRLLREVHLLTGRMEEAERAANDSIDAALRSGSWLAELNARAGLGQVLHYRGRWSEALEAFGKAEGIELSEDPEQGTLVGIAGLWFCQLLSEVDKPQHGLGNNSSGRRAAELPSRMPGLFKFAQAGERHMDAAQVHLTEILAIQKQCEGENWGAALLLIHVTASVDGLRAVGQQHHLVSALIVRSEILAKQKAPALSEVDLDEAWEIAERGPMRLHMADIHLYRARLFLREKPYAWESPAADLAAAEKLINECGYHRRDQELADAKRAILGS